MDEYLVKYRESPGEGDEAFLCQADNYYHAKEQLEDAYPDAEVLGVFLLIEVLLTFNVSE